LSVIDAGRWSELKKLGQSGAVVVIKIDGERALAGDENIYTVAVSGGAYDEEDYYHRDGAELDQLIDEALRQYPSAKSTR
jgi:hypothetical protein